MTFDSRESSVHGGQPVEGYLFNQGSNFWRFTSADKDITLPAGLFERAVISRGEMRHSQEEGTGLLEVKVARDNPVARLYIGIPPTTATSLVLFRAHRGELTDAKALFTGNVSSCAFNLSEATLRCVPVTYRLTHKVSKLKWMGRCNYALYGPGCQVVRDDFRDDVLVSTVAGSTIQGAGFALHPDGWYRNGWAESPTGEVRFIVDHISSTVTLIAPFNSLSSGETVRAFAGCDRTAQTCLDKFDNIDRHYGFPFTPNRNPHDGRII